MENHLFSFTFFVMKYNHFHVDTPLLSVVNFTLVELVQTNCGGYDD